MSVSYSRIGPSRGVTSGILGAIALGWVVWALDPAHDLTFAVGQTVVLLALLVLSAARPSLKVAIVRRMQRWVVNPIVRAGLALGVNPLGLALLETTGRKSGQPRRTPVGNGRDGTSFWIVAEHGMRAGYVRNIAHDPRVRVRLRTGLRYRWYDGTAEILPDDDPLARQRALARWHPLRAFNAMTVRMLGADLLTVHVRLSGPSPVEPAQRVEPAEQPQRAEPVTDVSAPRSTA